MPKRNRDKLMEQSLYDLLCSMNTRITDDAGALGVDLCVMNGMLEYGQTVDRCKKYCYESFRSGCNQCIADYLNEDYPF